MNLKVPFYGRFIPVDSLSLEDSRPVDLDKEMDLRLSRRTNGFGLPGCNIGWFNLKNGEKALAAVTDPSRVAFIPTREGYSVIVSVAEPGLLLEALRRCSGASEH